MKNLSIAQCFTKEHLSLIPQISPGGDFIKLGNNIVSTDVYGTKIVSALWNADGALEVVDTSGSTIYFTGTQTSFRSSKGRGRAEADIQGYSKAVKECQEYRQRMSDERGAQADRKKSKADNKSRCGFCSVLKCLFKIILGWFCAALQLDQMNNRKK